MKIFSTIVISIFAVAFLNACESSRINAGSKAVTEITHTQYTKAGKREALPVTENTPGTPANTDKQIAKIQQGVAKYSNKPWYGSKNTPIKNDVLPQLFKEHYVFNFASENTLNKVANRLTKITGVPIRVSQDVYEGEKTEIMKPMPIVVNTTVEPILPRGAIKIGPQAIADNNFKDAASHANLLATGLDMKWDGTLESYLDYLTGYLNLNWSYLDGSVTIEKYSTLLFDLEGMVGNQSYKMNSEGKTSSTSGFDSTQDTLSVNEAGKVDALTSLIKTVEMLVKPTGGKVSYNDGSGRLVVVARKDVLTTVAGVIKKEIDILRKEVVIQFDIYSVTTSDKQEYGVDWTGLITNLAKTYDAVITAPTSLVSQAAAGLNYTLLKTPDAIRSTQLERNTATRYGGSKVILNSLNQTGDSAKFRPIAFIAKHNEWARKSNLLSTAYVSESAAGAVTGTTIGQPTLKTSVLVTGDKYMVMPYLLQDGTVNLKIGVSLADLLSIDTITTGNTVIQTPVSTSTSEQTSFRLAAGEAMVITGMSRLTTDADRNALAPDAPILLGGSKKQSYTKEEFLIVVRATPISIK